MSFQNGRKMIVITATGFRDMSLLFKIHSNLLAFNSKEHRTLIPMRITKFKPNANIKQICNNVSIGIFQINTNQIILLFFLVEAHVGFNSLQS